jgi:predicted amidophosphoribosyltransferase
LKRISEPRRGTLFRDLVHPLLDFVLPSDCIACDRGLDARQRMGVCSSCWCGFRRVPRPSCPGCGLPRPESCDLMGPARGLCAACLSSEHRLDAVRAVVIYDELARSLVLEAKLGRRPELFRPIGDLMAADLRASQFAGESVALVPVPSHPWSVLKRGFSPATELARRLSRTLGLPLLRGAVTRRWIPFGTAKLLARRGRISFAENAFRSRRRALPSRLLLVDDVMTTGATLEACAEALKSAGATHVRAAVWARALPPAWPKSPNP